MGRPRSQNGGASSSSFGVPAAAAAAAAAAASEEELRRAKRSVQIDQIKYYLENDCLPNYMSKDEAAAFLLIEHDSQPAVTEIVWEELERQNPEFFGQYKLRLMLKDQIVKFNELLASQRDAMKENLQNRVAAGDPTFITGSTSADVSNSNSTEASMFPSTSGMHRPLSENQTVNVVNNGAAPDPMMDNFTRVHHGMNGAFIQNGNVCSAPMIDNSIRAHHHNSMNGVFVQTGDIHAPMMDNFTSMHHGMNRALFPSGTQHLIDQVAPNNGCVWVQGMDPSIRMLNEMNGAGIYSQATNPAIYNPSAFQQAMSNDPFDARVPHYAPPFIKNRPIFHFSEESWLDLMERNRPPSEANKVHFPLAPTMNLDRNFEGDFAERMINDLPNYSSDAEFPGRRANGPPNELNGTQGEDPRGLL